MEIVLKDFLNTGTLGEIRIGMSREECRSLFGEPAEFHRGDDLMNASIWINGIVTLWFETGVLNRIGLYFILDYEKNDNIELNGYFPNRVTKISELVNYMEKSKVIFSETIDKVMKKPILKTKYGVVISYSHDVVNSIIYPEITKNA